jgi:hypothetical protein
LAGNSATNFLPALIMLISISQRGDNDFIGNFLIENKAETIKLKELLWNVVKTNKLTLIFQNNS